MIYSILKHTLGSSSKHQGNKGKLAYIGSYDYNMLTNRYSYANKYQKALKQS